MAIADKLTELQATKTAIKTAIENKGQDLSGVPFTEYASKIDAIQGGFPVTKILNARKNSTVNELFSNQQDMTDDELFEIFSQVDDDFAPTGIGNFFYNCKSLTKVPLFDTSKSNNTNQVFGWCNKLKEVPAFDFSGSGNFYGMFDNCQEIEEIPLFKISDRLGSAHFMCANCYKLKKFPAFDFRSVTGRIDYIFSNCRELTEVWIKNIKLNLQVGSGTFYGTKLTRESALHLCKECRTTTSAHTLTFATAVYNDLETLYVKLVPITEEMRAEDDLIDEKLPFELCASTDEGAMTIASYMASKNWSIAK